MRTFYIFKINREMSLLMRDNPYNLFHSLEGIYLLDRANVDIGAYLLDQITVPIDKEKYNHLIYDYNKDNDFYMKFKNNHRIINKYRKEETIINVKNSFIELKTNLIDKDLKKMLPLNGLFACDFENKDYFWLEELVFI